MNPVSLNRRNFIKQSGALLTAFAIPHNLKEILNNHLMKDKKKFDVIIIGGSYSGLAAGMALGRALRTVLIIDSGTPCNIQTPHSHNFITQDGNTPQEISALAKKQVKKYETVEFVTGLAKKGTKIQGGFEIEIETGEIFIAKKLIFATGIKDLMPKIKGHTECWGISIIHCPYCHGYEVRNEKTGILSNGDSGFEFAVLISNWTKDLTLFTNGKSTLTDIQKLKLDKHNIPIIETEIQTFVHEKGQLQNIIFKNGTSVPVKAIYSKVSFEQKCSIPKDLGCELTDDGYIRISPFQRTTTDGIYACGDNVTRMRTVANAVSMGTTTGMMVNKELIEEVF